ncbi:hypothetical protein CYY_007438 [Polysphondylium violaceum]|uniref:Beta-lactamase-related domain-containing protein n=1 Tax=Polysphondylium violaceum TaxID=133409 RepID=A0A8J4UQW0_9MYCE|nr:hypothetical protein CYY_007438 [Polysphondylium violaceum]
MNIPTKLNVQDPVEDQDQSDPAKKGWMVGCPPPADKLIKFIPADNKFPKMRWSLANIRQLVPTAQISRGPGPISNLPTRYHDISNVTWVDAEGKTKTFMDMMNLTYTDGLMVLHKGNVIYEKYFGVMNPTKPHLAMSVTKSFVGTLGAILVHEKLIDDTKPVIHYVPELAKTAYGDATVRQVLDMTISVKYSEDYTDPNAEVWNYSQSAGSMPRFEDYHGPQTLYEFLLTLEKDKEHQHDERFWYKTVNTEILAWIIRRVTGKPLAIYLSERIWQRMGAADDAYFMVDSIGTESAGGGYNTCLHDLARFGEVMRNRGYFNGQQVIPSEVIDDIKRGGDKAKFAPAGYETLKGWSYRNMWWVGQDAVGEFEARGIHGQRIHINSKAEMTIVRYASHPHASNIINDPPTQAAYRALAQYLENLK